MFGFKRSKGSDEELSRQYVRHVFAVGHESCPNIAEALRITTEGDVEFPMNEDTSLEISLAILGTSLAVLKGHSQMMNASRGATVEGFCKRSIKEDYDMLSKTADWLNASLDGYQNAFQKALSDKKNPFGDISGIMLCRCLGPRIVEICFSGTNSLNPVTHELVGDMMAITITQTMTFWKIK